MIKRGKFRLVRTKSGLRIFFSRHRAGGEKRDFPLRMQWELYIYIVEHVNYKGQCTGCKTRVPYQLQYMFFFLSAPGRWCWTAGSFYRGLGARTCILKLIQYTKCDAAGGTGEGADGIWRSNICFFLSAPGSGSPKGKYAVLDRRSVLQGVNHGEMYIRASIIQ